MLLKLSDTEIQSLPPGAQSSENWMKPPTHLIKVNVDAYVSEDGVIGIGMVAIDNLGQILIAATWKRTLYVQNQEAEEHGNIDLESELDANSSSMHLSSVQAPKIGPILAPRRPNSTQGQPDWHLGAHAQCQQPKFSITLAIFSA
ncbi:hypothetical protein PIB30_037208 [Stylosanthes scabra]|uniref:RNase H type-1 domain-containing protein n=1 Tax=Stylosanthes scabra TaxID=79078 RepID=A0ABU6YCF3_9FABA|nr:hypothetical protein [Stylosanthes scabra]